MKGINVSAWAWVGIKPIYRPKKIKRPTTADDIIQVVSAYTGIEEKLMKKRTRKTEVVYARYLAIYLICFNTNLSLVSIGELFGDVLTDHTSVRHGREKIKEYISQKLPVGVQNQTQLDLINIEELLNNPD